MKNWPVIVSNSNSQGDFKETVFKFMNMEHYETCFENQEEKFHNCQEFFPDGDEIFTNEPNLGSKTLKRVAKWSIFFMWNFRLQSCYLLCFGFISSFTGFLDYLTGDIFVEKIRLFTCLQRKQNTTLSKTHSAYKPNEHWFWLFLWERDYFKEAKKRKQWFFPPRNKFDVILK